MNKFLLVSVMLISLPLLAKDTDPFAKITYHELPNGMKVVLAPNPKVDLVQVRVNVGVGMVHENKQNYGVSHLLEHVIFRNESLKDDMSYLQLIKEKEGEANGSTTWDRTSYFATVKKPHAQWLVETIHTMLMKPSLSLKHIATEKKTVLLEIGEPNPLVKALGFDIMGIFSPRYLKQPSYWEKEFGVNFGHGYTNTEEQLATLRLNHAQVVEHYKSFYDPSNMQILISGGFNSAAMLRKVQNLFGKHPTNGSGDLRPKYEAKLKNRPYFSHDFQSKTARMTLGHQVANISYKEKEILHSYTDYLSHRLMKRLRNLYGETYTVNDRSDITQGFGYFAIGLESSREKFKENYKLVKKILETELIDGKLSDSDIEEAKRLYLNSFTLKGESAKSLGILSSKMLASNEKHGSWETPAQVLSGVTNEEYLAALKKLSSKKHQFEMLVQPEVLFQYDYLFLLGVCCVFFFFLFRQSLLHPFKNDQVRWVRKVRYPPLKMVELGAATVAYFLFIHAFYLLEKFILETPLFQSMGLMAQYLNVVLISFVIIGTFQAVISFIPRKLYYMDDKLVIKSLSYFSKLVPKEKIKSISHVRPFSLKPTQLLQLWNSFFYFDPLFWRHGLLVELTNGKCYFFSTKNADKAARELKGLLGENSLNESPADLEAA